MTEHRKAIRNRKRDFEAHHDHVHRYSNRAIAAAVLIVNVSPTFKSPLRLAITQHKDPGGLVRHCLEQMRAVATRTGLNTAGLDARAAIVLEMDNVENEGTSYVIASPAPAVGDPMHYDAFIQAICSQYRERFCE